MQQQIYVTQAAIDAFCGELVRRERSPGTIEQYRRSLLRLREFLREEPLEKERLLSWKRELTEQRTAGTVNCMIAAVNAFLAFVGAGHLKLRSLKRQRRIFSENELTREEFLRLVRQAEREGDHQTAMLLYAMSGTGVRVSEARFLTVEAARQRMAVIRLKGKTRQIPLEDRLCADLLAFAREEGIAAGAIFVSKRGRPLDRRRIWERMKRLCAGAGVAPEKVHPHSLRRLFARMFYELTQDIAKLADLLGHGSIETTRIYIMTSCSEHRSILGRLTSRLRTKKPPHRDGKAQFRT